MSVNPSSTLTSQPQHQPMGTPIIHQETLPIDQATEIVAQNIFSMQLKTFNAELDFSTFQKKLLDTLEMNHSPDLKQWQLFSKNLEALPFPLSEKFFLLRAVAPCINYPIEQGELAQLLTVATYLKSVSGVRLFRCLFSAPIPYEECRVNTFITICRLLVELHDQPGLFDCLKEHLPHLSKLMRVLEEKEAQYLASKYPQRNLEQTLSRFEIRDDIVQFPLSKEELQEIKADYVQVEAFQEAFKKEPPLDLKETAWNCALKFRQEGNAASKQQLIAIITETIRHHYKIAPHDTQILTLLALINIPEKLKGRIAQMKTGEGKSTMIAMLAAFIGCQSLFVDVVTSSPYLAIRDCEKYAPFFKDLGLTVSHICHPRPTQSHFHGHILYGTNADFEFALLRDGLSRAELRYSKLNGTLKPRTFDAVIVDEVDNLFLDTALNSALLSIPGHEDLTWIYEPILNFSKESALNKPTSNEMIDSLRQYLKQQLVKQYHDQIGLLSDRRLAKWIASARDVHFKKKEKRDYIVKHTHKKNEIVPEIEIVDFDNTGRVNQGCQWRNGIHQLLQAKHHLKITPESLTAASLAHPTYFGMYHAIIGLTGTMGEAIEREEIQKIYNIDSFDVPPHFPSQRKKTASFMLPNTAMQHEKILNNIEEMQKEGRPVLVLFKSIEESDSFSHFLSIKNIKHQLINEMQKEEEDYLVARAGDEGMITIATNTAGRGTDILLSQQSKTAGGLHVIFTFFPKNLRVEGQGFGRAARQGQLGSGCMILSREDEAIQSLLGGIILDQELNGDLIFPLLDQLRSAKVRQESQRRYICSQHEKIYFEKLQQFFNQIKELDRLFKDKEFKEHFVQQCKASANEILTAPASQKQELQDEWISLQKTGYEMLDNHRRGITVNWYSLFDQFHHVYFSQLRKQWALYYNKLHDIDAEDVQEMRKSVENLYAEACIELNSYLLIPRENVVNKLKSLF